MCSAPVQPRHHRWIQGGRRILKGPNHNISASLEYGVPSWDVSHGSWHSIDWLQQILPSQIATGDTVWSPFVAAGWSEQEELNTRPAQWLGFLKLLTVTGAEYFYGGFFSLHPPFPVCILSYTAVALVQSPPAEFSYVEIHDNKRDVASSGSLPCAVSRILVTGSGKLPRLPTPKQ